MRLVDYNLAFARTKQERQSPGAALRALRARYASLGYSGFVPTSYAIWVGSRYRRVQIPFPQVNEYFDGTVLQVLRTAYELYQRDDLLSDLTAHFRRQAAAAPTPKDAIYPGLSLSAILWWSDERDEAIAELTKVVDASRAESELRLDLAELSGTTACVRRRPGRPGRGPAARQRDLATPRRGGAAGRRELGRYRPHGTRLSGFSACGSTPTPRFGSRARCISSACTRWPRPSRPRPPPRWQPGDGARGPHAAISAAGKARRRDASGDAGLAIVARGHPGAVGPRTVQTASGQLVSMIEDSDTNRVQAIAVMASSGRLSQLIARAKEEVQKTPGSVQIHQTLADYYTAARQPDKARAALSMLAELRPEDVNLRLQVANQLAHDGQTDLALKHYKTAFKKPRARQSVVQSD